MKRAVATLGMSACAARGPAPQADAIEASVPTSAVEAPVSGAAAGVEHPALADLLVRHWDQSMADNPVWATRLGDRRFQRALKDASWDAQARVLETAAQFREEAAAIASGGELSSADHTTLQIFDTSLRQVLDEEACHFHAWSLSPRFNALVYVLDLPEAHRVESRLDAEDLLERYRKASQYIDAEAARLVRGAEEGFTAPKETIRRTLEQVDAVLTRDVAESPLLAPLDGDIAGLSGAERAQWETAMRDAVESGIHPALNRWRQQIGEGVFPVARSAERAGVRFLPDGEACYAALVRRYTTLELTPAEVHEAGLRAVASVHDEFRALGSEVFGTDDLQTIFHRLRNDDSLRFSTEEEIEEAAREALEAANAVVPQHFGRLPEAPCEVRRIPDHEAPYTTIAYYQPPEPDGARPGVYFVNVHDAASRPRHEARALAFHEAVPGHHFQIAIAQELDALPAFRRHMGMTAFVEGWALYAERLADELGLYRDATDRLGMLAFDAWRAARLVVDTGIHHEGWTRAEAEQWMIENTPLATNNIVNEVDRYVSWPGQAVAYKTGQMELLRLRAEAEAELGELFDLSAFHDVVLGAGAVPLPVLRERVERWSALVLKDAESAQ